MKTTDELKAGDIFYQGLLICEKLVVFGDGKNDIDLFELADESYAVSNAHEDLKKYATAIISSNDEDGVAKWLERTFRIAEYGTGRNSVKSGNYI